ncbi:hypothetical protein NM208_g8890 [Fusarium decemcellulare]|uniref:Uncharacterized protein n=1 Tax=Fusarium decemcellulare TaxID=57161 RepID=A0ACC1S3Q9_9HYPO|nr:hypothetical protein NM208_g8890 [Fusarium decemcellulare]
MQALWSRAGQAHRCGCRVCETAVSALGRRVTTAAARPRKVTFAEIFTACYSSMFATAAVVDAVRKEDRRQELDRQLEETRRELAELQMLRTLETNRITSNLDPDQTELSPSQMDKLWESLKDIYTNRPYMKEIDKPATLRVSEFLNRLHADHYNCPDEATMHALRQTDYERLEQAIMDEEIDRSLPHRAPLNHKHLHNDSRTIVHLVKQLLRRAEAQDNSTSPCPSFEEARQLAEGSPSYTFDSIDPNRARGNRITLNRRLREVIDSTELDLKEKVGRVCYNLLVSAYPPDMHTYNTLIVAFDKHGHKCLSEPLVNSFFYYRRLQPTPSTFVAILNHYKSSGNHGRFLRALACITGLDAETGAKLGRRHVDDVIPATKYGKYQTRDKASTQTGDWIWQHAPLDKSLVEVVINGLLHFKLFDQAANFFVSCMKANVILSTNTIKQLFDECILALDWKAAVRLVQGFTDCPNAWPSMLMNRNEGTSYLISRLHVLLDLCGLRSSGELVSTSTLDNLSISAWRFNRFLNALARADSTSQLQLRGPVPGRLESITDDLILSSKSRLLQIEGLWKEQALIGKTTRSIESKLLYPDFSPQFRVSMALHIGNTATEESLVLNGELVDVLSQLRASKYVQETIAECEHFQNAAGLPLMQNDVVERQVEELDQSTVDGNIGDGVQMSFRDEKPTVVVLPEPTERIGRGAGRLRARPRRLITWPVPDQRPAYMQQGQLAGLG